MLLLSGPLLVLSDLTISLLLSQLGVNSVSFNFILGSMFIMLTLGLLEHVVNVKGLSIEHGICLSFEVLLLVFDIDLLFAPVSLL